MAEHRTDHESAGKKKTGLFAKPWLAPLFILCGYVIVNYVLRVSSHPWAETLKLVNFAVFAYLLYRVLRKPLVGAIDSKIADVDELLRTTESELAEATAEHERMRSLLDSADAETSRILTKSKQLGIEEQETLVEDGRRRANNVLQQGKITVEGREREVRQTIREEIAKRCVGKARDMIGSKLTPEKQLVLIRSKISRIGRRS